MKKLLLSFVILASLFVGCNDEAQTTNEQEVNKVEVIKEKTIVTKVVQDIKKKEVVKVAEIKTVVTARTGVQLYKACAGCHGVDASKKALGKSQIIKSWDKAKLENALNGYKDGTYGGTMKGLMKGQVAKLSSKEISDLSEYISKF